MIVTQHRRAHGQLAHQRRQDEGDRPHPGRPVRQPDRCQGNEQISSEIKI